jgi:hypothetical protein
MLSKVGSSNEFTLETDINMEKYEPNYPVFLGLFLCILEGFLNELPSDDIEAKKIYYDNVIQQVNNTFTAFERDYFNN